MGYISVMVTVLVVIELLRLILNTVSLHLQRKEIDNTCKWLLETNISDSDIDIKRDVDRLMYAKLRHEIKLVRGWQDEYERIKDVHSNPDKK